MVLSPVRKSLALLTDLYRCSQPKRSLTGSAKVAFSEFKSALAKTALLKRTDMLIAKQF